MKKIAVPLALIALFLLLKKKKVSDTVVVMNNELDAFKKTVLDKIKLTFADNDFTPDNATINKFIVELRAATMPQCELLNSYISAMYEGVELPDQLLKTVDTLALQFPFLFQVMAQIAVQNAERNPQKYQYRYAPDDLGNPQNFWSFLEDMGNNLPYGKLVIGVGKFIANLFCGKRCRLRKLQDNGGANTARMTM